MLDVNELEATARILYKIRYSLLGTDSELNALWYIASELEREEWRNVARYHLTCIKRAKELSSLDQNHNASEKPVGTVFVNEVAEIPPKVWTSLGGNPEVRTDHYRGPVAREEPSGASPPQLPSSGKRPYCWIEQFNKYKRSK